MPFALYYLQQIKARSYNPEILINAGFILTIVFILPMLTLHLNYYFMNRGDSFYCDLQNGFFKFIKKGESKEFYIKDIESIVCHKSWPLAENRTAVLPWDIYNYATITLISGQQIKLSSLLVQEFDKKIDVPNIQIKKTFYPWIS